MNSQSDNKSANTSLQKLKQTTAESMRTMTETPYLPIVYGIPKDDWKAMLEYLKATSEFQPTLYARFNELAAVMLIKEDWNTLMHALNKMGERCGGRSGESGEENRGTDAENSYGEPRTPHTGWENERSIFLRSASGSQWTDWGDREFTLEDEEVDSVDTPRKRRAAIRVEFGDLSSDEVSGFFENEDNTDDEDIDTEYPYEQIEYLLEAEQNGSAYAAYLLGRIFMCGKIVPKDIPEAIRYFEIASARGNSYADYRLGQIYLFEPDFFDIDAALEHLNRSAQAGNESAAMTLQRMAENSFLAITTNVLELVGVLCDIEPCQPIEDCTALPQKRERRKWEQSM